MYHHKKGKQQEYAFQRNTPKKITSSYPRQNLSSNKFSCRETEHSAMQKNNCQFDNNGYVHFQFDE